MVDRLGRRGGLGFAKTQRHSDRKQQNPANGNHQSDRLKLVSGSKLRPAQKARAARQRRYAQPGHGGEHELANAELAARARPLPRRQAAVPPTMPARGPSLGRIEPSVGLRDARPIQTEQPSHVAEVLIEFPGVEWRPIGKLRKPR